MFIVITRNRYTSYIHVVRIHREKFECSESLINIYNSINWQFIKISKRANGCGTFIERSLLNIVLSDQYLYQDHTQTYHGHSTSTKMSETWGIFRAGMSGDLYQHRRHVFS